MKLGRVMVQDVLTRHDAVNGFHASDLEQVAARIAQERGSNILTRTLLEAISVREKSDSTRRRHFPKGKFLFGIGLNLTEIPAAIDPSRTPMLGIALAEGGDQAKNGAFYHLLVRSWIDHRVEQLGIDKRAVLSIHRQLADTMAAPVNASGHGNGRVPVDDLTEVAHEPWIDLPRPIRNVNYVYGAKRDAVAVQKSVRSLDLDPMLGNEITRTIFKHYDDRVAQRYKQEMVSTSLPA